MNVLTGKMSWRHSPERESLSTYANLDAYFLVLGQRKCERESQNILGGDNGFKHLLYSYSIFPTNKEKLFCLLVVILGTDVR